MTVGMTDSDRQSVGGIFLRRFREVQENTNHLLDLFLGCFAVTDDSALNLQGAELRYSQPGVHPAQQGRTTGMTEFQGRLGIFCQEYGFNRHHHRLKLLDDRAELTINFLQPDRQFRFGVGDDNPIFYVA